MRNRVYTAALTVLLVASAGWAGAALRTATVEFRHDDIELTNERSFSNVSVLGCTHLAEVGEPDLPVRLLRFVIPADMRVEDVLFECAGVEEVSGSHVVRPAQPRIATGQQEEWVDGSESIYGGSRPYPESRVEYLGDGFLGGYRIATVAVHPLQYEPATGRLLLARDVSIELELAPAADRSLARERVTSSSDATYRRMVASLVENPEDLPAAKQTYDKMAPYLPSLARLLYVELKEKVPAPKEAWRSLMRRAVPKADDADVPTSQEHSSALTARKDHEADTVRPQVVG